MQLKVKLTEKQEECVQEYVRNGGNGYKALTHAYNTGNMSRNAIDVDACRFFAKPKIVLRLAELQASLRAKRELTTESVLQQLQDDHDGAVAHDQFGPAIRATELLGKSLGVFNAANPEHINLTYNDNRTLQAFTLEELIAFKAARDALPSPEPQIIDSEASEVT